MAVSTFNPEHVFARRGAMRSVGATIRECVNFMSSL
jgi:hypothetical protein